MNYLRIYNQLIYKAQNREFPVDEYGENHHIIPRCIDKSKIKDESNKVKLYAREHFIAHLLLYKIYSNNYKIKHALFCMYSFRKYNIMNNKIYERIMIDISKVKSNFMRTQKYMLGKEHTEDTKERISKARKGKYKGKDHHLFGKKHSKEAIQKIKNKRKLQVITETMKDKYRELRQGKTYEELYGVERADKIRKKISYKQKRQKGNNAKTFIFYSPCGIKHVIIGYVKTFCKENNFCYDSIRKHLKNDNHYYKGWYIIRQCY